MKKELYIGLDVHKDSLTVAVAQGGRDGEVRLYGTVSNDLHAIEKLLTRLRKEYNRHILEEASLAFDLQRYNSFSYCRDNRSR